ncbi:hypothetical protein [Streptomyces sp. GF20]|uniref:hypothetical protein n=1 Tax=Streptomyces sp. GF20 TaxID=2692235 RepID=UPI0019158F24|nr:hypothetical protein [Streptomyces sp. GF20]
MQTLARKAKAADETSDLSGLVGMFIRRARSLASSLEADPRFPSSLILHRSTGELLGPRYLGAQDIHALDSHFGSVLERLTELQTAIWRMCPATPPLSAGWWT